MNAQTISAPSMKKLLRLFLAFLVLLVSVCAADDERKCFRREEPKYPAIASKMNLHGTVKMKVWINPDGSVRRVDYIGGHPILAESALKAIKTWKYEAGGKETTAVVELKF